MPRIAKRKLYNEVDPKDVEEEQKKQDAIDQRYLIELKAFHELKEDPWAYNYVYPEYFDPSPVPGVLGNRTTINTQSVFNTAAMSDLGQTFIHFCPGLLPELRSESRPDNATWLWFGPNFADRLDPTRGRTHSSFGGAQYFSSYAIISGYLHLNFGSNSGTVVIMESSRGRRARNIEISDFSGEKQLTTNELLVRFRSHKLDDHGLMDDNELICYDIICYGFPPNLSFGINVQRTAQGTTTQFHNSMNYIKDGGMENYRSSKHVIKRLLDHFPAELQYLPLREPMAYLRHLFTMNLPRRTLFPIKLPIGLPSKPTQLILPNARILDLHVGNTRPTMPLNDVALPNDFKDKDDIAVELARANSILNVNTPVPEERPLLANQSVLDGSFVLPNDPTDLNFMKAGRTIL